MSHLARLHELPCIVCEHSATRPQASPTVVHHLESIRDELSSYASVPLCDWHHKELHSLSRRGFEARYRLTPIDMLAMTIKLLEGK